MFAHSGAEARAAFGIDGQQWGTSDGPYSHMYDYDKHGNMTNRFGWGGEVQHGAPNGGDTNIPYTYSTNKNQRNGFTYDAAGNLKNDQVQNYSYDATNQQTSATSAAYSLLQGYDGNGLRGQKNDNGATTYYLRSTVLGGAAVAELDGNGGWQRGYVYAGDQLLAIQSGGQVYWSHEDGVTKSKRVTDIYGNVVSTIELDPWGADTNRSSNAAFLPQSFATYIRDDNGGQDAMARRYSVGGRFAQPDPYGGSYNFSDPQSLNRYAYAGNDPVNREDPSGLDGHEAPPDHPEPIDRIIVNAWGRRLDPFWFGLGGLFGEPSPVRPITEFGPREVDRHGGDPQNPYPGPKPQPHPTPAPSRPKPPCIPNGSADVGAELITPFGLGPKGGAQLDSRGVYPYFGLAAGTPGKGIAVSGTANKQMVTPGITVGFSAAFIVGFSYSSGPLTQGFRQALRNGNFQFGGGTPGFSGNVNVVLDSPKWLRRIWPCQ